VKKLRDLYPSKNYFLVINSRWSGMWYVCVRGKREQCTGEERTVYDILITKFKGKESLGRPRLEWENNIKMGDKETRCKGVAWSHRDQDRGRCWDFVNTVMNLPAPQNA